MNFGYFCNTTNWNKKPYAELLDEARDISVYCDNFVACEKTEEQLEMREILANSVRILLKKLEQKF